MFEKDYAYGTFVLKNQNPEMEDKGVECVCQILQRFPK